MKMSSITIGAFFVLHATYLSDTCVFDFGLHFARGFVAEHVAVFAWHGGAMFAWSQSSHGMVQSVSA